MNLIKFCCRSLLVSTGLLVSLVAHAEDGPVAYGLIVKMKSTSSATNRETPQRAEARLNRAFTGKSMPMGTAQALTPNAQLVRWERPLSHAEARKLTKELEADANVEWVVPNVYEKRLQVGPTDPVYSSQWWLSASPGAGSRGVPNIRNAWDTETGSSNAVNVAVLDTGLLTNHPDLQGPRFATGYDMVTNEIKAGQTIAEGSSGDGNGRDPDFTDPGDAVLANSCPGVNVPEDDDLTNSWHGTRIAGQIGAMTNNGMGVAGINRNGRIITVRVAGKCGALVSDIIAGMRWAAGLEVAGITSNAHPADIINLSFGSASPCNAAYQETIDELLRTRRGVLLVAAAGNDNGSVYRPANCRGAFAVGAVHRDGLKASYSNFGSSISLMTVGGDRGHALAADDAGIMSTTRIDDPVSYGYTAEYGTSFSAPIVAGVASLMRALNPNLTVDQITYGLQLTARPHIAIPSGSAHLQCGVSSLNSQCYCTTATCGPGILDAAAALAYADPPGPFGTAPVWGAAPAAAASGGGALGLGWLIALALAVAAVFSTTRRVNSLAGR